MNKFYDWKPEYTNAVVTIIDVSIGFTTYWFLAMSEKIKALFFAKFTEENAWVRYVVFQKLTDAVFMGFIPGIILLSISDYTLGRLGLKLGNVQESLIYIGIIGTLIFVINYFVYFVSKNPFNLNMYPQMRLMEWSKRNISIILWHGLLTYFPTN